MILIVLTPIYLVVLPSAADEPSTFYQIASLFGALLIILFVYAMVRLFMRIHELRKRL